MISFKHCSLINDLLQSGREAEARDELIKLLDYHRAHNIPYTPVLNHLIRQTGLYPYMKTETAFWEDRLVFEAFKVPISKTRCSTLHRDQSLLLKYLLEGENIAVSAPTSFGKSFVIDAFIQIKRPTNVVIIVPTLALTDETRRRLYKKFASEYKIITTTDVVLGPRNIFVFPQERAINYLPVMPAIDILIVDEFYKSSSDFDSERAPSLVRAILKLGRKAGQRYFLAPNISELGDNPVTKGMTFVKLDLNTVFLEKHELYLEIGKDEAKKNTALLNILRDRDKKSLIYAGTYSNIDKVAALLIEHHNPKQSLLLKEFTDWLERHYGVNWDLPKLIKRGTGIHNGQMHRSLSQLQIKLFEDAEGLNNIISTSSIIEGVNTSAENVIVWRNKNGNTPLNDFTYKNIIGRGGRMFRHFIGKIYILEAPPADKPVQLEIPFPDEILGDLDGDALKDVLTREQIAAITAYRDEMQKIIGIDCYNQLVKQNVFQTSDFDAVKAIATQMKEAPAEWTGLAYLNSNNPNEWDRLLYKVIRLHAPGMGAAYGTVVKFVKVLSSNWTKTLPELLEELESVDVGHNEFFKLERNVSYLLASALNDVNVLHKTILGDGTDISPFVAKMSHAFLPKVVFQLEEFGFPRMLSRRVQERGIINFEDVTLTLHPTLDFFKEYGKDRLCQVCGFDGFDRYILEYFYDGLTAE